MKQLKEAQDASRYKPPEPVPVDGPPGVGGKSQGAVKKKQAGFSNLK